MSSELAISTRALTKAYRISHQTEQQITLAQTLWHRLRHPRPGAQSETFQALDNVSFDIARGEVVGIIGRNGAGKSTLLKILSQITAPTQGEVRLYGQVGSLLEVGTGFHPDLTGRENIFLNGAVLGMRKREIENTFDAIVEFAGIGRFLDTPVKRYSSGMYMRLAFSVAAHLRSDILIVDEVLAVGDAPFQQKCLGKIQEAGAQGRTVIFVSHNLPLVMRLCPRVLVLENGLLVADGDAAQAAKRYHSTDILHPAERQWPAETAPGDDVARLRAVRVLDDEGCLAPTLDIGRDCFLEIEYWNNTPGAWPCAAFHLINEEGLIVFASADFNNLEWRRAPRRRGLVRARCCIPRDLLAEGQFSVLAAVCSYNPNVVHAVEREAIAFRAVDKSQGEGARGLCKGDWPGLVRPLLDWEISCEPG